MLRILKIVLASIVFVAFLLLKDAMLPALAQEMLPQPDPTFDGKIGVTYNNSEADPSILRAPTAEAGAPNILLVLLDDVGFGAAETFGGPIKTPTLEHLANTGLRYNRFHTTALCSPTRAALLTGRNHHSVGTGVIQELATGFPGYTGLIPKSKATVGQLLQANGYSTAWFGKNHNVPDNQSSMVGPFDRQPNGLGFDYFYGFVGGETDQWYPALYENQNPVDAPATPEEGYNLTHDLADRAISWMRYQNAIAPNRPFFLYFAPGATHAPHQPPPEYPERYRGQFDMGWDVLRQQIFEKQKELGVIPANTELTPRPDSIPAWDSYDDTAHKLFAREMETYAGFLEYTDVEVGRVIDAIDNVGELDNTLVIYIVGDNGASAEGGFTGSCNEIMNLNGLGISLEENLNCYEQWGGPETSPHYAVGWAWGLDAPFRWTKQVASYFGGTRNPMVISWPERISDRGGMRSQFLHVIDIAPTVLEVAGVTEPRFFNGISQSPIEGDSFTATFTDGGEQAPETHPTQYFEMFAHRALYDEGWMASAFHRVPWDTGGKSFPIDEDRWELFNLDDDFSQSKDLSAQHPEKLKELQDRFLLEGERYNVFPIDDRTAARFDVRLRPSFTSGRDHFDFYPGAVRLPEGTAPNVKNTSYTITANLQIPETGAEGVIIAMGGTTGGYALYLKNDTLVYEYNYFGVEHFVIESDTLVPSGDVQVRVDFDYDGNGLGKGGSGTLYINDQRVGEARVTKTVPVRFTTESQDIGMDLMSPVGSYQPPFVFTGTIENVSIDLR